MFPLSREAHRAASTYLKLSLFAVALILGAGVGGSTGLLLALTVAPLPCILLGWLVMMLVPRMSMTPAERQQLRERVARSKAATAAAEKVEAAKPRTKPTHNIDGTLMLGDFDMNGNAYGFTGHSGPTVNVDGSPMLNGVDVNGNPFGVTSNH